MPGAPTSYNSTQYAHAGSTAITAHRGSIAAGSIGQLTHTRKKTKINFWGIAAAVLFAGAGGTTYWVTEANSVSVSEVGAAEGEAGVRDTWQATAAAVQLRSGETVCSLMAPDFRRGLEDRATGTCAQSVGEVFGSTDTSTFEEAGSIRLEEVVVKGQWAEVVDSAPGSSGRKYSYMERLGDRWRWSQHFLYAEFHPDKCPEIEPNNWYEQYTEGDPKCLQDSVFRSDASGL
ncbi:hypothetical protein ABZ590_06175 [Streptomyces hirsutus]|uniref:hypothetical protein n=1 Tax=Streptomyces hirsutus TaxID=35620 RepID=UPI0033FBFA18